MSDLDPSTLWAWPAGSLLAVPLGTLSCVSPVAAEDVGHSACGSCRLCTVGMKPHASACRYLGWCVASWADFDHPVRLLHLPCVPMLSLTHSLSISLLKPDAVMADIGGDAGVGSWYLCARWGAALLLPSNASDQCKTCDAAAWQHVRCIAHIFAVKPQASAPSRSPATSRIQRASQRGQPRSWAAALQPARHSASACAQARVEECTRSTTAPSRHDAGPGCGMYTFLVGSSCNDVCQSGAVSLDASVYVVFRMN